MPGLPGWLKVRLNGWADPGAVEVLGGAEKLRVPRDPELMPPPMRASADDDIANASGMANDNITASAPTMPRVRCKNLIWFPQFPGRGKRC
jgi:hypothetical protein